MRTQIRVEELLVLIESRFAEKNYEAAQVLISEAVELGPADPKVLFYAGSVLQAQGDIRGAAMYFERAGLSPGLDEDFNAYEVYLVRRQKLLAEQFAAVKSGIPSVVLTSLPRSASAFITNFSSHFLGVPSGRMSISMFPDFQIVPLWAGRVSRGGIINHEHFPPTPRILPL